jgi:hypothetical protein
MEEGTMPTLLQFVPLLIFIGLIFGIYRLIFWLKKKYPSRLWIGLLLCLLTPIGHFYLDKAWSWVIGLGVCYVILKAVIGDGSSAYLIANILSLFCFWYRFFKAQQAPTLA